MMVGYRAPIVSVNGGMVFEIEYLVKWKVGLAMRTILKYEFPIESEVVIKMPQGGVILSVQAQRDVTSMWVFFEDSDNPLEDRKFHIYGTGHKIDDSRDLVSYIGTIQIHSGNLVFHVFEV